MARWLNNVTNGVLHCYNGIISGDTIWTNVTTSQSKNVIYLCQLYQIMFISKVTFSLYNGGDIKCDRLWQNTHEQSSVYKSVCEWCHHHINDYLTCHTCFLSCEAMLLEWPEMPLSSELCGPGLKNTNKHTWFKYAMYGILTFKS